ncbi:MFS transporter [Aliiglaciecola sp. 3_MG-2023]|uniref:MFS transporter n=1 Tax=Aliiglaciecola sp. 3_MG-2023 TaxID=3062644 RepID=UPI0026E35A31|nr:MFS transporter [Aliiglaciecola sp. 3_MG-2023]MDO6694143.1 MFS transporter [Aliiglaciecola sp. 3_MG-2023]
MTKSNVVTCEQNPTQVTAEHDKIPLSRKFIYGLGALVNNLLGAAIGGMVIVLNLGLAMNPALVGLISALPRLTDALTDPLMGYISDNTKTKWGRRRPYIFWGAIAAGIIYALIWQLPREQSEMFYFWFFLIGSLFFYLAYTVFATPYIALGYELTPDYHERTRLMAVQNFMGQMAYLLAPWFLWFMQNDNFFDDMIQGAGWLAIIIGAFTIFVGILPAIFLKEPNLAILDKPAITDTETLSPGLKGFFQGFAEALKNKPFLSLCGATFLVFNGFMMVSSFQFYVIIYYVFAGDTDLGSEYAGWAGTLSAFSTFCVIFITAKLSTLYGKRHAFFIAIGLSIVGYGLKWFCYSPENPWLILLPVPFISFGLGGLFTLMGSMIADVCDFDELKTFARREGMFGSIYWWVVKLGMAVALAAGGFILNGTGFDVALGGEQSESTITLMRLADVGIPIICSFIAIGLIVIYPITEGTAREVRDQLETRRGKV